MISQSHWIKFFFSICLSPGVLTFFFCEFSFMNLFPGHSSYPCWWHPSGEEWYGREDWRDQAKNLPRSLEPKCFFGCESNFKLTPLVCLKYNANSPINIKGIFWLNDCICKAGFFGWDVCHVSCCLVSGHEFHAGKRLAWSVISGVGNGRAAGSSAASPLLFHGPEQSFIGLKVKTRCMSLFSSSKYFFFFSLPVQGSQHVSFSNKQGEKRFLVVWTACSPTAGIRRKEMWCFQL